MGIPVIVVPQQPIDLSSNNHNWSRSTERSVSPSSYRTNFYFTARRYKKHPKQISGCLGHWNNQACISWCQQSSTGACKSLSIRDLQRSPAMQQREAKVIWAGPSAKGVLGRPRKPKYNLKYSFSSLQRCLAAEGDHRVQQCQGESTQSCSTVRGGSTESITVHCRTEISLQGLTCNTHKSLKGKAPPEEDQALK